ncbi:MAG: YgiQ family radical SAM protein [Spirochaetales bacterium]|nr:YgiQ family radical SAM protein [Spirochaetales bacterium]
MNTAFLPVNRADLQARNWPECDFVIVSGDAYVDHPAFAAALLGRLLEAQGWKVGIIAQPDCNDSGNQYGLARLGQPRLAWLVSAGAMDSMVARYTANNKPRSGDSYSPGGKIGFRPDRAIITYVSKIREISKGVPIIIGGIEASLRRMAHYDYWSNTVRRSVLLDSKADLLVYGMGETPILEIADKLSRGEPLRGIRGTCWRTGREDEVPRDGVKLPSFEEIKASKEAFCEHYLIQERNTDPFSGSVLVEQSEARFVVQEKPCFPLETAEFDRVMELPYARTWHPDYDAAGGIPALEEVQFSLTSCRGCFGACAFCAITFHQGRLIQTRSHESLEREAVLLSKRSDFKGYIHDVGGPSANFRVPACEKQKTAGACPDRQCLGTEPCPALKADHSDYVRLLRRLRALPNIKKVFVRSGIRFDYVMKDPDKTFLRELCEHHVSGQLKVAPEHTSDAVLSCMRKSSHGVWKEFEKAFQEINADLGKKQYLIPYYIASHPGADLADALHTALALKKTGFVPDQVQDFYPTPGTLATCMYWTGLDPETGKEVPVARGAHERALQRALLQFNKPENRKLVIEALQKLNREDLLPVLLGKAPVRTRKK